jgi:hypothetical protein
VTTEENTDPDTMRDDRETKERRRRRRRELQTQKDMTHHT